MGIIKHPEALIRIRITVACPGNGDGEDWDFEEVKFVDLRVDGGTEQFNNYVERKAHEMVSKIVDTNL